MVKKSNEQSSEAKYRPLCMLAHDLVNRLTTIIGHCDLLAEEADEKDEAKRLERVRLIRCAAESAAKELQDHLCHLDSVTRMSVAQGSSRKSSPPLSD